MSSIVTVILILAAILSFTTVIGALLHDDPSVFGYRCFYVMTGSMEPTIPTDSLVFTKKSEDGKYEVGDIITFASEDPTIAGSCNTHRIAEIRTDSDGSIRYVTKGDANPTADAYTVAPQKVHGRVVYNTGKCRAVGKIVTFVMTPQGFLLVIIIPLVLVITSTTKDYVKIYKSELDKIRKGQSGNGGAEQPPEQADDGKQ